MKFHLCVVLVLVVHVSGEIEADHLTPSETTTAVRSFIIYRTVL